VTEHLPVLQVLLPLLAAPICVLIRRSRTVKVFAILVSWCTLAIAAVLLRQVLDTGTISYAMGGWAGPSGIEYRVTVASAYVLVIVTGIASVVLPFGLGSAGSSVPPDREYLLFAALLLCIAGLLGITITGDAFNVFVFLEVTSLSSYALISMGHGRRPLMAAFSYLTLGTIGGTFILLGIGLLYQMTGTLNIVDMAPRLAAIGQSRTMVISFGFLLVGIGIKLAIFPLHQWLPNAYTYAPSVVSAFLAATATKVSYYLLARVVFTIFGAAYIFGEIGLDRLLLPLSLAAMFLGSIAAIHQTNIKRLLAYSSIAQIGYMTLGLSFNSLNGLTGGFVHLFNHALMKGGLFLVVACITFRLNSSLIEDMRGLGRRMPVTMAAFVVGGLSLIGVPATVGFVSKWYLVMAAIEQGRFAVAGAILLSSILAVVYIWKIIETAYFREPPEPEEGAEPVRDAPLSMLIPTWILIGGTVYFGLHTSLTAGVAMKAAEQLLSGIP
jgi:multicomponent Na+:H+ antiporter subunit D